MRLYFRKRGRKDPAYLDHMDERFGHGAVLPSAIWVHATSLGEMISMVPVVEGLLDRGHNVVTTHHTPAGRHAAERALADHIAEGRVVIRYVPLEYPAALRRFLSACQPKLCLIAEIDLWPSMIWEARAAGVPVWLCNTQFLTRSFERDHKKASFRGRAVQLVSGAMTKSDIHSERFRQAGVTDTVSVGETRFEQTLPAKQIDAAADFKQRFGTRPVIGIVNTVEVEEEIYLKLIQRLRTNAQSPVFVVVPRAPERFAPVHAALSSGGTRIAKRSQVLSDDLTATTDDAPDIVIGDTLGEMYFYLGLCDFVIMGGSFNPRGSHNVVEPLALGKPVIVGPNTWTIEYPVEEAIQAGSVIRVQSDGGLQPQILTFLDQPEKLHDMSAKAKDFYKTQLGAVDKILAQIDRILRDRT
ncbi:MAG: glycosyltransferase N-terminal domain-containing protein [Pseudomonadota bacterium]